MTVDSEREGYVLVASTADFPESGLLQVLVNGDARVLVRTDRGILALDGICTHEYACLVDGELEDDVLWCPFHGAGFNVQTGAVVCPPAVEGLRTYDVQRDGDDILVSSAPLATG